MNTGNRDGQASVEFLAALPALLVVAALAAQILAVGYASVLAGNAAEAAALALAGGGDPRAAARAALPGWTKSRAHLTVAGGEVHLRLRPPALLGALARKLEVHADAAVEEP
jgi:Flp pilus assembly protein TadG